MKNFSSVLRIKVSLPLKSLTDPVQNQNSSFTSNYTRCGVVNSFCNFPTEW